MKRYVTITGINHYFGNAPFKKGKEITLVKEPHNEWSDPLNLVQPQC